MQEETLYDTISSLENFMDGLVFIDTEGRIIFHKLFSGHDLKFKEKDTIGKKLEEVFIDYDIENSPLYRAVRLGEYTINQLMKLRFFTGEERWAVNTVYPVKQNNEIIGAVSASQFISPKNDATSNTSITSRLAHIAAPTMVKKLSTIEDIIGDSPGVKRLKSNILKVSETMSNVMIIGETGTGKELVAQSIHSHSQRNNKPFIVQNCAAIPHTLLESIFFGTTKGSFTDATDNPGIFEQADGGTIFLDEVNSMDISLQSKILRVLEDHTVTRLGGKKSYKFDVRIISATNQPPKICLAKELLRRDLYYRLSTLQLQLPTLSERMEDIHPLVEYFIQQYNRDMHRTITDAAPDVYALFEQYDWPGNIRELKNVVETAFNFASSSYLTLEDLPDYIRQIEPEAQNSTLFLNAGGTYQPNSSLSLRDAVDDFEKNYILMHADQARSLVELADRLHISKQLLNYKLKKYDLTITFS